MKDIAGSLADPKAIPDRPSNRPAEGDMPTEPHHLDEDYNDNWHQLHSGVVYQRGKPHRHNLHRGPQDTYTEDDEDYERPVSSESLLHGQSEARSGRDLHHHRPAQPSQLRNVYFPQSPDHSILNTSADFGADDEPDYTYHAHGQFEEPNQPAQSAHHNQGQLINSHEQYQGVDSGNEPINQTWRDPYGRGADEGPLSKVRSRAVSDSLMKRSSLNAD